MCFVNFGILWAGHVAHFTCLERLKMKSFKVVVDQVSSIGRNGCSRHGVFARVGRQLALFDFWNGRWRRRLPAEPEHRDTRGQ